ncbi:MAG: hypothetical protein E6713_14255 [Sporomusaceae bacterium]|nr:hypothetical protein [Sporomusaceae bacterium]
MKYIYTLALGFVLWHFSYMVYSTIYSLTVMFFYPSNETLDLAVKVILVPLCFWGAYRMVTKELSRRQAGKEKKDPAKAK